MSFLVFFGFIPGLSGLIQLASTFISFSESLVATRPPIAGNPTLYLAFTVPFILSSVICPLTGGAISYNGYLGSYWVLFSVWALILFLIAVTSTYFGIHNIRRLEESGDQFNANQLKRAHAVLGVVQILVAIVLVLHCIFIKKIDASSTYFLLIFSVYRVCFYIVFICGAVYAWVATTYRSSGSSRTTNGGSATNAPKASAVKASSSKQKTVSLNAKDSVDRAPAYKAPSAVTTSLRGATHGGSESDSEVDLRVNRVKEPKEDAPSSTGSTKEEIAQATGKPTSQDDIDNGSASKHDDSPQNQGKDSASSS